MKGSLTKSEFIYINADCLVMLSLRPLLVDSGLLLVLDPDSIERVRSYLLADNSQNLD